jgi:glycosyltransferase involved in cell wall biosynthesis
MHSFNANQHTFDSYKMHHPFRGTIQSFLYRQYIKRAEFIQALSLEVFNSLIELGYPENQIILLGHGITLNDFNKPADIEAFRNKGDAQIATILMVGRLSWEKNYLLGFKVIAELVKKCPVLQVIIAGTGPDFSDLVEIRDELNLQDHVEMVGWQPNIAELMFSADLLLHLSLTESYGQVLLEACLCNLHVFTFPVGIALDLEQSHNPFMHILDNRNPEIISDSIFEFLKKKER